MNEKKENIDKLEDDFREENSKETLKSYYYKVSLPTLKLTKKRVWYCFSCNEHQLLFQTSQ